MADVRIGKEELQEMLAAILGQAQNHMNPADRMVYDEQLARLQRMEQFKGIVAADVAAQKARSLGCSHRRWPKGHDLAGHPAPVGQGEWVTGGQLHGNGRVKVASLICLRGCGATWQFFPNDYEFGAIEDRGMLGWAPPDDERLLERCMWCSELQPKLSVHQHEQTCKAKPADLPMKKAAHSSVAAILEAR